MSDYTAEIQLPDHKLGDKWVGIISIGPVTHDGGVPDNELSLVRMTFKHISRPLPTFLLSTDADENPDAPITMVDSTLWSISIPEVQKFLRTSGDWLWDMQFLADGDGSPQTYFKGILTVHPDVTK